MQILNDRGGAPFHALDLYPEPLPSLRIRHPLAADEEPPVRDPPLRAQDDVEALHVPQPDQPIVERKRQRIARADPRHVEEVQLAALEELGPCHLPKVATAAARRQRIRSRPPGEEILRRGQAVTCGLISSTVFFTDWKERSNIAFSSALNSTWWIFSIPFSPMVTGTPM